MIPIAALLVAACGPAEAPAPPPAPAPVAPTLAPDDARAALDRALAWFERYDGPLRFDAAVGAHATCRLLDDPGWCALADRRIAGAPDPDHEHRRFFDPAYRPERLQPWSPPADGTRVNPNRVVTAALYCADGTWTAEVEAYACGGMRDRGGFHTTHALWALVLARDAGCTPAACVPLLVAELATAQPDAWAATTTVDVDLYAERLLTTALAGVRGPDPDGWAAALVAHQEPDGSWGVAAPDEAPYFRYHATMSATWGLAAWLSATR